MAMTIGSFQGIFPSLGNFDDGSLSHSIRFQDPFPMDAGEKSATLKGYTDTGMSLKVAMQFAIFSEDQIAKVPDERPVRCNETVIQ